MENKIDGLEAPLPKIRKQYPCWIIQIKQQHPSDSHYKKLVRDAKRLNWLRNVKPTSLLNYQISITNDSNSGLKEIENALNIETLRIKAAEILSRPNNPELEMDFRATCSNYQTNSNLHDPLLMQAYQDYLQAYQQKTSLYIINWNIDEQKCQLEIYDTENETKESKILKTPEKLDSGTSITQLPNGKLFCFGDRSYSGIVVLIDVNGVVEVLPSGNCCSYSSCIYFDNSVYCFGGHNKWYDLNLSNKFDLDRKRWIQLTPMPNDDYSCSNIILNGNILISGCSNRNLLLYSIDIDSFSTIPYKFAEGRKILINAERLYLIELCGSIYECEIESYTNWRRIGASLVEGDLHQVYCSYNKGGIYICHYGWRGFTDTYYYKFDLNKNWLR